MAEKKAVKAYEVFLRKMAALTQRRKVDSWTMPHRLGFVQKVSVYKEFPWEHVQGCDVV